MDFEELPEAGQALVTEATQALGVESLALWRRVAREYPRFLPGRLNYASALLLIEGPEAARGECDVLEAELGEHVAITGQRALIELAADRPSVALSLAEHAIAGGYAWPPLFGARAEALLQLGRIDEAEPAFLDAYRREPHAWFRLERYCELAERPYTPPEGSVPSPVGPVERQWLYAFIDRLAHTPDEDGRTPGCDHTLRFVDVWCDSVQQDPIALYQFLNARGGFCDCEVIREVEPGDVHYDEVAVAGSLEADAETLQEMLETGVLVVRAEAPEEVEDDGPVAVEQRGETSLRVWPQLVRGRSLGMLLDMSTVFAGQGASATLVVIAPDAGGARYLWIHGPEGYAVRNLSEGETVPDAIETQVRSMLEELDP